MCDKQWGSGAIYEDMNDYLCMTGIGGFDCAGGHVSFTSVAATLIRS
jgi:hypothetical protein